MTQQKHQPMISRRDDEYTTTVYVTLPDSGRTCAIDIYNPTTKFGAPWPAQVNWSGIGSVSGPDALAYAEAIQAAVVIADAKNFDAKMLAGQENAR